MTFRLVGSLPIEAVLKLKQENEEFKHSIQKARSVSKQMKMRRECGASYFRRFDDSLDRGAEGPTWLSEEPVAAKVAETIRTNDGKSYDLLAYCLMPNHVHLLATFWELQGSALEPDVERSSSSYETPTLISDKSVERTEVRYTARRYILAEALKKIKGVSATECNKLLNRRGAFWHHESYDHLIRDEAELDRTIWYILENPVKAGFCGHWQEWKWSYVKKGMIDL